MAVVVPVVEEALNGAAEGGKIAKYPAPNGGPVQDRELARHVVHPAGAGGREVEVETRMAAQPLLHLGVFVGGVVVQHQVDLAAGTAACHSRRRLRNATWRWRP